MTKRMRRVQWRWGCEQCLDAKSVSKATDRSDVISELETIVHAVVHAFTEVSTTATPIIEVPTPTAPAAPIVHVTTTATTFERVQLAGDLRAWLWLLHSKHQRLGEEAFKRGNLMR
jgi:hypothetical protein